MNKTITKILACLVAALLIGFLLFNLGASHEKSKWEKLQVKANAVVVEKNEKLDKVAEVQQKIQIEYRDRIVIKYKTIKEEVTKYEQTEAARTYLDPGFVRLHDLATSYDKIEIAESASGVDGSVSAAQVTSGEGIKTIVDNYEQYYQCAATVKGWQEFYSKVQKTVDQ